MNGEELTKLLPDSLGFFVIDNFGGVVDKNHQAWIFEGDDGWPHPITRSEILDRGGYQSSPDEAAEHIGQHPGAIEVLNTLGSKKNDLSQSSTVLTKPVTRAGSGRMKARVAKNRVIDIPI